MRLRAGVSFLRHLRQRFIVESTKAEEGSYIKIVGNTIMISVFISMSILLL